MSIRTSSAPTSLRTAPASWARVEQSLEHATNSAWAARMSWLARNVSAIASNSARNPAAGGPTISSRKPNSASPGSGASSSVPRVRDRLVHPLDDDRRDQVLLGREVAKQRAAPDAGALRRSRRRRPRARARRTAPRPRRAAGGGCARRRTCSVALVLRAASRQILLRRRRAGWRQLPSRLRPSRWRRRSAEAEDQAARSEHHRGGEEGDVIAGHAGGRARRRRRGAMQAVQDAGRLARRQRREDRQPERAADLLGGVEQARGQPRVVAVDAAGRRAA